MFECKDQLRRKIMLWQHPPKRIISLVPSQTELLYDLGLDEEVIGIIKFCVHPEIWFRTKQRVGGTKQLNLALIRQLNPDLIIANKEENKQEEIEELVKDFPVWISDIHNLEEAYQMIRLIGELVCKEEVSHELVTRIKTNLGDTNYTKDENYTNYTNDGNYTNFIRRPRTCYLIWKDPYMTVGGDTFIH